MRTIYLDQAATSYPKPPQVLEAMSFYLEHNGANVARGGYDAAYEAADMMLQTRVALCALFDHPLPSHTIFTQNVTTAINIVLKGLLHPGDHILVSSLEHNAVMRPLSQLAACGVAFDRIPSFADGTMDLACVASMIRPNTRAILTTHVSNVCGTIFPIETLGALCQEHGLFFLVDAAQSAGVLPISMQQQQIDCLFFTGHKGLLGPQGTGGFLLREALATKLTPLLSGGTGSFSDSEDLPPSLPDRFEPGTPNLPGIYGLREGLRYLEEIGIQNILEHERKLIRRLNDELSVLPHVHILGGAPENTCGILSVDFVGRDNAQMAFALSEAGILTRCGLHCAPHAHKTLKTYPQGTVRFSVGPRNTLEEIEAAACAVRAL